MYSSKTLHGRVESRKKESPSELENKPKKTGRSLDHWGETQRSPKGFGSWRNMRLGTVLRTLSVWLVMGTSRVLLWIGLSCSYHCISFGWGICRSC